MKKVSKKKLNVWIIKDSEPITYINNNSRKFRYTSLSLKLLERGHKVHFFVSSFDHYKKSYRNLDQFDFNNQNFFLHVLEAQPYKRHVSIARLISHVSVAFSFNKAVKVLNKPDVIIASIPTIELGYISSRYSISNDVPLIIDINDLWPDFFRDVLPKFLFKLIYPYFFILRKLLKSTLNSTLNIIGLTQSYVDWAISFSKYDRKVITAVIPLGYPFVDKKFDNKSKSNQLNVIFVGSMTRQFDINTVLTAANDVRLRNVKFVFVGNGDKFEEWKKKPNLFDNIEWCGWLEGQLLNEKFLSSNVALLPYIDANHFKKNITNKFSEYLAYGLPILSSIKGEMGDLVTKYECGFVYQSSEDLIKIIIDLQTKPELLETYSKNAYELHKEMFNIDKINNKFADFIQLIASDSIEGD
jgi:glycosyltransferase involved in cell wall biosynthesis